MENKTEYSPEELKSKILSGEIAIQLEPAFVGRYTMEYVRDRIIGRIDAIIEFIENANGKISDKSRELASKIYVDDVHPGLLLHPFSELCIHNSILDRSLNLELQDNVIKFVEGYSTGPKLMDYGYRLPDMTGWDQPIQWEITVPSRHVLFVNFFKESNPRPEDEYSPEYSLNGFFGRRNLTKYFVENNNIGYGQMGNMSISIYSNGSEIIISPETYYLKDVLRGEYSDDPAYISSAKKTLDYIEANRMMFMGSMSLSMWRYECGDYEETKFELPELTKDYGQDVIDFSIHGSKLVANHYYRTNAIDPELGEACYARIKVLP